MMGLTTACHNHSSTLHLPSKTIQKQLHQTILKADALLDEIMHSDDENYDDFFNIKDIAIYQFQQDELVFWNTNLYEIDKHIFIKDAQWHYAQLSNAQGIYKWYPCQDADALLIFIAVKADYPYENDYLSNDFHPSFKIDKNISISNNPDEGVAIKDIQNEYLFSLIPIDTTKTLSISQDVKLLIFYTILSILILLIGILLLFKMQIHNRNGLILRKILLILYVFLYLGIIRSIVFNTDISFYISGIQEINWMSIWTQSFMFMLGVGLFVFLRLLTDSRDKQNQKSITFIFIDIALLIASGSVYYIIYGDFIAQFVSLLVVVLIFNHLWRFPFVKLSKFNFFAIFLLIVSLISYSNVLFFIDAKKTDKYRQQTEFIYEHGHISPDPLAELMLEELNENLLQDNQLQTLLNQGIETDSIYLYLNQKYLQAYWSQFDIKIHRLNDNSNETKFYRDFVYLAGQKVKNTDFYSLPASIYDISFIGLINVNSVSPEPAANTNLDLLLMEFQPKTTFKTYSFPELLIREDMNNDEKSEVSIAKYEASLLSYTDYKFNWNKTDYLFNELDEGFSRFVYGNNVFYVYTKGEVRIILTETTNFSSVNFVFYTLLLLFLFLMLAKILQLAYVFLHKKQLYPFGLTAKFQLVFIFLLLGSFFSILVFSVNYIKNNYRQEQVVDIEKKKHYVQKSLQDIYYWITDLAYIDKQELNIVLQDLAYNYQTDINVFDNKGRLMGSSQPLIFNKHLISTLMNPEVYFSDENTQNQYEKIGDLSYLATYADLVNGDYLQLGYISIPQYFSQQEINEKLEHFLGTLVQIYLIIIILSILLILLTGRRLAKPLYQLESKMKMMRLDGKNEKVEYKSKDEIGQLVEQYNRTVDELEKHTQLLLSAEREATWRNMARQVAHEINNPLTPMKLTLQQLQRTKDLDPEQFDAYFEKANQTLIEQINNLSRIASSFSELARMPETEFSEIDIAEKLIAVVNLFKTNFEHIDITYEGPINNLMVFADAEQIIQVFNNILKNATQAILPHAKGKIDVLLESENNKVLISFSDNGPGIPKALQDRVFKPNFTTKSTGMGLGLSISKSIVENMGGEISFISKEDQGTKFLLSLPLNVQPVS